MLIYFAAQVHRFELRSCFQVSSILQQDGESVPAILIDYAVLEGDKTILRFPPYNFLRYHPTDRETFARRAYTRNEQIKRARSVCADWIFFADCDHVYAPTFFAELGAYLAGPGADVKNCITGRFKAHTTVAAADVLVQEARDHHWIEAAWERCVTLPRMQKRNRPCASGAMQVCSLKAIDERAGGLYVKPGESGDNHLFEQGQRAKSDIGFREVMGGSTAVDLPMMIHLQHRRDKEEGRHLEEQR